MGVLSLVAGGESLLLVVVGGKSLLPVVVEEPHPQVRLIRQRGTTIPLRSSQRTRYLALVASARASFPLHCISATCGDRVHDSQYLVYHRITRLSVAKARFGLWRGQVLHVPLPRRWMISPRRRLSQIPNKSTIVGVGLVQPRREPPVMRRPCAA
jgi:hypothetical protein